METSGLRCLSNSRPTTITATGRIRPAFSPLNPGLLVCWRPLHAPHAHWRNRVACWGTIGPRLPTFDGAMRMRKAAIGPGADEHGYGHGNGDACQSSRGRTPGRHGAGAKLQAREGRNYIGVRVIRDPAPRFAFQFQADAVATLARYTDDPRFAAIDGGRPARSTPGASSCATAAFASPGRRATGRKRW